MKKDTATHSDAKIGADVQAELERSLSEIETYLPGSHLDTPKPSDQQKQAHSADTLRGNSAAQTHTGSEPVKPTHVEGYGELDRILDLAYRQSALGKGHARHAYSPIGFRPWQDQPILANARQVGPGGPAQQIMKKAQESVGMSVERNFDGAKNEALGVIVYAAALFKLYEEMEQAHKDSFR